MIRLEYIEEFKKLLQDYQMSDDAKRIIDKVPYTVLTAITSSGRNTIIAELVKTGKFYFTISDTTRPPRDNNGVMEQNGVEYWFKTEAQVIEGLKQGKYIEAALIHNQQVSGSNISELEHAQANNLLPINEIEVQGVEIIKKFSKKLVPIFVLPPSYQEWMRRWSTRGQISEDEKNNRMHSAKMELETALSRDYYHFLVNDDLSKAVKGIQKIIEGQIDSAHEAAGKQVATEILRQLNQELATK